MSDRPPGRPRKKNCGVYISAYVEKDIYDYLHERVGAGHISEFIDETLRYVIKGNQEILKLQRKLKTAETECKIKSALIEKLQKENEYLKNKIEKLESEIEELKGKDNRSKILAKFREGTDELGRLAEEIKKHIREGATWREVLEELGITDVSSRMDILHRLYSPRQVPYRGGFLEKNDILISEQIKDYVLEKQGRDGYDSYVFKKRGDDEK